MKKSFLSWVAILMVVIMSVNFMSCSGDDENGGNKDTDASSIVGTWVLISEKDVKWGLENGEWVFVYEREKDKSVQSALCFGADGTYYKMYLNDDGSWSKGSVNSYSIQGNNLIFSDSHSSPRRTFSISGNILEIIETEIEGDEREDDVRRYRKM